MKIKNLTVILVCFLIGSLRLYGMDQAEVSGKRETTFRFDQHNVVSMEWSNCSNYLAVIVSKSTSYANLPGFGSVQIIDPNSHKTYTIASEIKSPSRLKWSLDDELLFAFGGNFIYAWNVSSGKLIWEKSFEFPIVAFDLTYSYFAVAFANELCIFSYSGDLLRNFDLNTHNIKINFGDFITFSSNESLISIYSYEERKASVFNIGAGEFIYAVDDIHRKNIFYSWAFPRHEPDCFRDGILSSDRKFLAKAPCTGRKGTVLPRHSIKISSLY